MYNKTVYTKIKAKFWFSLFFFLTDLNFVGVNSSLKRRVRSTVRTDNSALVYIVGLKLHFNSFHRFGVHSKWTAT